MRGPHTHTTETYKKPHSQVAAYLAQAPLKPDAARNSRRRKSNPANPIHPREIPPAVPMLHRPKHLNSGFDVLPHGDVLPRGKQTTT
jgi:hypothetical protein